MYKTVWAIQIATAVALKPLVANANHCEVVISAGVHGFEERRRSPGRRSNVKRSRDKIARVNRAKVRTLVKSRRSCCAMPAVSHVIVGHSERRQYYLENDHKWSAGKLTRAVAAGLTAIVCIRRDARATRSGKSAAYVVSEH